MLRLMMHGWDRCIAKPFVRIWPKRVGKRILCFGDSNTWGSKPGSGLRYAFRYRWPGVLQTELGKDFVVLEEGRNGRTTVLDDPEKRGCNGKPALDRVMRQHQPLDVIIILLGTNDLKSVFNRTAEHIAQGVEELGRLVLADCSSFLGTPPILLLVAPPALIENEGNIDVFQGASTQSALLAERYRSVAARLGCEFFDAGSIIHSSVVDGIHWDQDAHYTFGRVMAQRVRKLLIHCSIK